MRILVIDIGGNNVKLLATGQEEPRKFPSGPKLEPGVMVKKVLETVRDWSWEAVSIGYPGPVVEGKIVKDPVNLGPGWAGFDFAAALGKPVKVINDAAMQAAGSFNGGRMLFLGLGTGLGTAMVLNGFVVPMEVAHLPFRKKRSYEDYLGEKGMKALGLKKWFKVLENVVNRWRAALVVDDVVLGGGNVKKLDRLPAGTRPGDNRNAFEGGFRLWQEDPETGRPKCQVI